MIEFKKPQILPQCSVLYFKIIKKLNENLALPYRLISQAEIRSIRFQDVMSIDNNLVQFEKHCNDNCIEFKKESFKVNYIIDKRLSSPIEELEISCQIDIKQVDRLGSQIEYFIKQLEK